MNKPALAVQVGILKCADAASAVRAQADGDAQRPTLLSVIGDVAVAAPNIHARAHTHSLAQALSRGSGPCCSCPGPVSTQKTVLFSGMEAL